MRDTTTNIESPVKTTADHALALMRGAISSVPIAGGVSAELFSMLVRTPYDRRADAWMRDVGVRLRALSDRDEQRFRALLEDETFASVLITASQAAVRSNHSRKTALLANAVDHSAVGIDIASDLQLVFIRFIDELTLTHVLLLRVLAGRADDAASAKSYEDLYHLFLAELSTACSRDEFQLFCNDLSSRMLARFSDSLDAFPGVAQSNVVVTEDSGLGPKVVVTDLGRNFLRFVETNSNLVPPSNTR